MRTVILQKHQTLIDIALQYCGSVDALSAIAELNDIEPTEEIAPGTSLLVPDATDKLKVKYLVEGEHVPITGITEEQNEEGLEIWALEVDFIIS